MNSTEVVVVGLGKIGLPLAVQIAGRGHHVVGADVSARVVESVNAAIPPFPGEFDLDRRLAEVVDRGTLSATTDTARAVAGASVVVVVVPLVVDDDGRPDFAMLDAATETIGPALRPGTLISYETTLPVGTTRGRFTPALAAASGLTPGRDLFVCHSPERVFSGRIFADLRRYPKLVGGVDEVSASRAVAFYESALEFDERPDLDRPNGVWDVGSAEAAELAKLADTTYRDINIAFANELACFAERLGIDVHSVIDAANSQPFSHIHKPGIAVGGHCIPVYPHLYLAGHPDARIPAAARAVNLAMPAHAVGRLASAMGGLEGRRIAVLGAAYRGEVKETAFSGVFDVHRELVARGAIVGVHDPLFDDDELRALGFESYHLGQVCDGAVVQADHAAYRELDPRDLPGARVVLDGRRVLEAARFSAAGVEVLFLGSG